MDRAIEPQEIRSRKFRRWALMVGGVFAAVIFVLGLRSVLRPGVDGARVRMAEVERGGVEATILTSGTVLPAMEQVIPSPFEARVQRVLEHPGKGRVWSRARFSLVSPISVAFGSRLRSQMCTQTEYRWV